jgi:hypothetical protein
MMIILFVNTVRLSFLIVGGNDSFSELWVLRGGNYTSFYVIRFSKSIAGCAWIRAFVSAIDLMIMNCIRRNQSLCFVGPIKLVVVILEYLWWETDFSHSRFHLLLRGFFFFFFFLWCFRYLKYCYLLSLMILWSGVRKLQYLLLW